MARYTSNKKLSEMKTNNKNAKKALRLLLSGVATISIVSGFIYPNMKDHLEHNSDVRNTQIEFEMNDSAAGTPVLSKYLKDNKQTIDKLRRDLVTYQEYHNMPKRSEETEKEMEKLIEKLSSDETRATVVRLALNTVKAKMADTYKLKNPSDIKIIVSNEPSDPREYYITDSKRDKRLFKPDIGFLRKSEGEKMQIHDTIEKIINLQDVKNESSFEKKRNANAVYALFNSAIKTANTRYIAKNGKLMEVGEPKVVTPTLTQKVKDDDERGS